MRTLAAGGVGGTMSSVWDVLIKGVPMKGV